MARRPFVPETLKNGPFYLDDALRAGLSRRQLEGSSWRRLGPRLYCWAGRVPDTRAVLKAVQECLGGNAVMSGRTAGWVHGLDLPGCDPIEVTLLDKHRSAGWNGVLVRRRALAAADIVQVGLLRVTSPPRTVIDLGRDLALVEAVVAVDMALNRRLVRLCDLHAYLSAHPGCHRAIRLRRVLQLAEPAAESAMETRLRLALVLGGLPRPRAQVVLRDDSGHRVGRADLYYEEARLAIEYDGATHRASLVADSRRQNRFAAAGY